MDRRPLLHRLLAGLALAALLAAGGHCSWMVYTDRADFSTARPPQRGEGDSPAP